MLRIWGRKNSINVQKVLWAVREVGLQHERIDAGGAYGGLDSEEYGRRNPNRKIPVVEHDGLVLWESNVIVRYLAARSPQSGLWPADAGERAIADQWMDWQQTTLGPDMGTVFMGLVRTPPEQRNREAIDKAAGRLERIWGILDAHLAERPYVTGERFSMGDIPVGAMCHRYRALELERPELEHLEAWYRRLQERPGYREHVMLPLS